MPPKSKRPSSTTTLTFVPTGTARQTPSEQPAPSATQPAATLVSLAKLHDSPYLAADRVPQLGKIQGLRDSLGGAAAFCSAEGADMLRPLAPRERDLALLAASIAIHGVQEPLVARSTSTGIELVSGLRRRWAAELAGVPEVPVWIIDGMSDEEAAARVARSNHNRAPLSPWQFARLVGAIRAERAKEAVPPVGPEKIRGVGAPRRPDSAASVARAMSIGYSTAKEYLTIQGALGDEILIKVAPNLADVHSALGTLPFRGLRELAQTENVDERVKAIRVAIKLETVAKETKRPLAFEVREKGKGAYVLKVRPVEKMPLADAERFLEFLRKEEQRVETRIHVISRNRPEQAKQEPTNAA